MNAINSTAVAVVMTAVATTSQAADTFATPDEVIDALYDIVSADAGEARDWDRFQELFADGAQLVVAIDSPNMSGLMTSDVETLIAQTDAHYSTTGFHEVELERRTVQHGALASVYSTFEVKLREDDPQPLMRGLNHFQMLHDGERWWVISNSGVMETPGWSLPENL